MTVMWTTGSVTVYTLVFLNKYLSGSIFINYYFDGISGIIADLAGEGIYRLWRVRTSFLVSIGLTFFGLVGIFLF
jgi:hypothetical protein